MMAIDRTDRLGTIAFTPSDRADYSRCIYRLDRLPGMPVQQIPDRLPQLIGALF